MNVKEHYAVLAGKKLRELRLEQKYTAAEFARLAGIKSEQQLYRYERGMNKITIDTLIFALSCLQVDIPQFFESLIVEEIRQEKAEFSLINSDA
ncbi:DNA-binding helix-turn-helix protein [Providencia rettgeri DSM 1131]|uniref:helix-turn-helix domain-containing protein n=1 Tax=Providencia rettgeri TaxID=587 RepID=UPI000197C70D|nr:helix-turn-helix transcriptional regulator [Providencia rettgeri]EFE51741.1 DNA-binding helix-turn-helix protein [Providencia rettgeri DSM 1131]QXA58862.1 helix-turn-helix domain-containing protein [Providencia rettgeri]